MPRWRKVWIVERKRSKGTTYRVCHLDEQGNRVYPGSFWSMKLAKEYRGKLELYLNGHGPLLILENAPPSAAHIVGFEHREWTSAVDQWLSVSNPRKPKTKALLRSNLEAFRTAAGFEDVEDVTTEMIAAHLLALKQVHKAQATIGQRLAVLRQFMDWARPKDNPCTRELLSQWKPYRRHKRHHPHYYPATEFDNILSACNLIETGHGYRSPLWWRTYLTMLHDCGMRLNEAAHLTWGHIDLAGATVDVRPHKAPLIAWEPKGTSSRTLPLTDRLVKMLTDLHTEFASTGVPYVFLPARRYRDIMRDGPGERGDVLHGIRAGFVRIRKSAGIHEGTVHDLRRTAITNWAKRTDLTPKDVQYLAGHADIKTTLDIYAMIEQDEVIEKARLTPSPSVTPQAE